MGVDPRLEAYLELASEPPEEHVRRLYRLVLRRDPEPEALARDVEGLGRGRLSPATLLAELVGSAESARVRTLDDAVAFASWARAAGERPRGLRAPPGTDERAVEIPWVLARYRGEARVLDVGYAFAEPVYLAALLAAAPAGAVSGLDLAEADVPGLRGVRGDVREAPLDSRAFDVAICISTLEHVGRDNAVYGLDAARDDDGMARALRELRRVLAPGGRLLISVPCGEPEEHDWFVQRDEAGWLELFGAGGFLVFEHEVYELRDEGWRGVEGPFDPAGVVYGARGPAASAVLCAELHPARPSVRARAFVRRVRGRGA